MGNSPDAETFEAQHQREDQSTEKNSSSSGGSASGSSSGMGPHFSSPPMVPPTPSKFVKDVSYVPLSLQISSDIHLEFYYKKTAKAGTEGMAVDEDKAFALFSTFIKPSARYLALLGDIGDPSHELYRLFLSWCSKRFEKVLVVLGNHEFYGKEYYETLALAQAACNAAGYNKESHVRKNEEATDGTPSTSAGLTARRSNVIFCHNAAITLDNHLILATTLWSAIPKRDMSYVKVCMNDYRAISIRKCQVPENFVDTIKANPHNINVPVEQRFLTPEDTNAWYHRDVAWIKSHIAAQGDLPIFVLTHHAPSLTCSEPDIPPSEPLSQAFCSPLDELFVDPLICWGFGHTHFPMDVQMGTCRVKSNPAGYPKREFPKPYGRDYDPTGTLQCIVNTETIL